MSKKTVAANLDEFIRNVVEKSSFTDVPPLFVVACESSKLKNFQKSAGYSAALAGADVVMSFESEASAYAKFLSLFADGIFVIKEFGGAILAEAKLISGEKDVFEMKTKQCRAGVIYKMGQS